MKTDWKLKIKETNDRRQEGEEQKESYKERRKHTQFVM
jgi:hypothetical protein